MKKKFLTDDIFSYLKKIFNRITIPLAFLIWIKIFIFSIMHNPGFLS
ncbi:MAG: hypothetical protein ACE5LC_04685 [Candidatus Aminicenantales bacterium]